MFLRAPSPRPLLKLTQLSALESNGSSAQGLAHRDISLSPRQNPTQNPDKARRYNDQQTPPCKRTQMPAANGCCTPTQSTHYRGSKAQGVRHTRNSIASTLWLPPGPMQIPTIPSILIPQVQVISNAFSST